MKTFHHRDTEDTEKFKKQSGVLCVSSEKNERVVKRIINPDNSDWSEVDNQIIKKLTKTCKKPNNRYNGLEATLLRSSTPCKEVRLSILSPIIAIVPNEPAGFDAGIARD